mmetsp:Transcript_68872/g.211212  ORF Transcript_68872/g.211212 Transcript_68872/m.211212 type:complete len:801 (-) Transcript_68872:94-2496(-)
MYVPRRFVGLASGENDDDCDANLEDIRRDAESAAFLRRSDNNVRIQEAARDYTFKAMKLIVADNENCLDRDIVLHWARTTHKRNRGLLSLPFSLAFFLIYSFCSSQHEDVANVYQVESGLRVALGKSVEHIKTLEDTWAWLNGTLFPVVFSQTDDAGRDIEDKNRWSRILSFNNVQGPLFLEQERSIKELCTDSTGIASDAYCFPDDSVDTASFGKNLVQLDENGTLNVVARITPPQATDYVFNTTQVTLENRTDLYNQPFHVVQENTGRRLRWIRPEYSDKLSGGEMSSGIKKSGVFRAVFPPNVRYPLIQERFNYMWENGWLDTQTKHISVRVLMLNDEFSRPRLQSYKLTLSNSRAGDIFAKLTLDTIFLESYSSMIGMAADGLFCLMLLVITIFEFAGVVSSLREGAFLKKVFTGWFVLEWAIIGVGWGVMLGYQYIAMLTGTVTTDMAEVTAARQQDYPAEFNTLGVDLHNSAGSVAYISAWHRLVVALYHLLLMFRFFVAFRAQPRLGVVINTLEACLIDIIHFFVILLPTFLAYAYAGIFVFGRRIEEFSNIRASIGLCFKIMTESEFDWPYLSEEHVLTSMIWAWTFMLFLSLVMLNLVLAIVLEVYSEQRKMAGKSESVMGTMVSCYTVARNYKRWVSTAVIIDRLTNMPRMISLEALLKEFPSMPDKQVKLLLAETQLLAANIHAGPEHMQHTMRMAMAMKVSMDEVTERIEMLDEGSEKVKVTGGPMWLAELSKELSAHNYGMLSLQWRLQQINWSWQAMEIAHGKAVPLGLSSGKGALPPTKSQEPAW